MSESSSCLCTYDGLTKRLSPQRELSAARLTEDNPITRNGRGGSVSRRDLAQLTGTHSHFQAEPPMQKRPTKTPAALREGVRGRRFSQRSGLPRRSPTPCASSGGSAREGLLAEKPPPSHTSIQKIFCCITGLTVVANLDPDVAGYENRDRRTMGHASQNLIAG